MRRVLAALPAKLAELQTVRGCFPVLGRGVVFVFALRALQLNNFPGHELLPSKLVSSLRDSDSLLLAHPALPRWANEFRPSGCSAVKADARPFHATCPSATRQDKL